MKKIFKFLYHAIPFKKELFSILRIIWSPPFNIYKHLHFKGVFRVKIFNGVSFNIKHYGYQIENEIFWKGLNGGWEKESLGLWINLCKEAKVVFDIGANTGVYSLVAKAVNSNASVYAFEPVNRVFNKLKENTLLNSFDTVLIEKAVSNSDGTAIIYDTNAEHTYSVTVNKDLSLQGIEVFEVPIKTITLDSFIKELKIPYIDLIKIDVETHEPEVLEGFKEFLPMFRPTMLIEVLNDNVGNKIFEMIKDLDYLYFNIDEEKGIRQVSEIGKSDYYNFILCNKTIAKKLGLII